MTTDVYLRPGWIDSQWFESAFAKGGNPLRSPDMAVRFVFPVNSKLMVDAGIRLLCLIRQLDAVGKQVTLEFQEGREGAWGYLDRMGFLKQLPDSAEATPARPAMSAVDRYRGTNPALMEFEPIRLDGRDRALPGRLADVLLEAVGEREDANALGDTAFTVLSELIDNVYEHSESPFPGYAVQQVYRGGGRVKLAVSDSGRGLLDTLKGALEALSPRLANLSDTDLVVEAFRNGLSRCGGARGGGLKACADHAVRYRSKLWVRLASSEVRLEPSPDGYAANMAYTRDNLPLLWGTHIAFDFGLAR